MLASVETFKIGSVAQSSMQRAPSGGARQDGAAGPERVGHDAVRGGRQSVRDGASLHCICQNSIDFWGQNLASFFAVSAPMFASRILWTRHSLVWEAENLRETTKNQKT